MAQVKKLMINGIRSFNPKDSSNQMIEFYSPMTLIVGQNGCGKTTIIEALKFAITNDYPPGSSKGQSFVNDPKLSAGYEVAAAVKLELEEKNGKKVYITRRLKATQKGKTGNVSVQMVEATIRRTVNGKKEDISSKCIDMKNEMCRMMGVSEAILNNVIFCHQEDACWPLTEGKKVKEKFDAIFNTTMYMKALDELTKKDKELGNSIKVAEACLKGTTESMKEMKLKKDKIDSLTTSLVESTDLVAKQEKEAEELASKLRDFEKLEKEYAAVSNAVAETRTKINVTQKTVDEIKAKITELLPGSLPELVRQMSDFKLAVAKQEGQLRKIQVEYKSKETEWTDINDQKNKFLKEEGQFQLQESENVKRLSNLKQMITDIISVLQRTNSQTSSNSTVDSVLESEDVRPEALVRALAAAVRSKESEHNKIQTEFNKKVSELQMKLDGVKKSKSAVETEMKLKAESIKDNKIKIDDLRDKLISIEGSNDALALLDDDEARWTEVIDRIQKSNVISKCEKEIEKFNEEIKKLEKRRTELNEEIQVLSSDKNISDQISFLNRQKLTKNGECTDIKRRVEDQVRNILGDFPEEGLSEAIDKKIKTLTKEVNEKEKHVREKKYELNKQEAEEKLVVKELLKKESTLEALRDQINEVLEGSPFEIACSEAMGKLDEAQKDSYYNDAAQFLYKKYIQKLRGKKKCCPLCKRDFAEQHQTEALITELEGAVENLQTNGPADKSNIEKLKERHQSLIKLKPRWEDTKSLEIEIPVLQRRKDTLEGSVRCLKEFIEEGNDSLELMNNDLSQARSLVKNAGLYDQNLVEVKNLEKSIKSLEVKRDPAAKNCKFSLPEAESERQSIEGTIAAKRLEKDTKDKMRNTNRDELTEAQQKRNAVKEDKLRITSEIQNREAFETQKKTLEENTKELQTFISDLGKKVPILNSEIGTLELGMKELNIEKESTLAKVRAEKEELEVNRRKLSEINEKIKDFETVTKVRYAERQKQFTQCKRKLEECGISKKELYESIDTLKSEISNKETKKRNLHDNIDVKTKENQIAEFMEELGTKEATLAATLNRGVTAEKKEISTRYNSIVTRMHQQKGSQSEIQKNLAILRKELSDKPYTTLEVDHCKNLVTKTVTTKAQRDIRLYKTALDHAIMKFHHKKMETINTYLKYFWKKIYKGNDIDYIQIKTDNDDALAEVVVKIAAKKKAYNYRVVMIRMGIELDMRGRCSAGQKVLASIIIRMALAQTFSTKCGIITLDEPTTNLDKRNIDSLADTLSQLASEMKHMKTFQLVIITHDQEFIDKLLLGDPADYYFKVSRDRQGYSQIERICRE